MTETEPPTSETVLVMNPQSGTEDHIRDVRDRAQIRGYRVEETRYENHAIEIAESSAGDGVSEIVAVGGDGTVNEVVTGVHAAGALEDVTVGVIPTGTGDGFATSIGIRGIDDGFTALEEGERRWLDIGVADERPFVNTCLVGIIAEASEETSTGLKSRLGGFAYVVTTAQKVTEYTGIDLEASVVDGNDSKTLWEGTATLVLVGNGRRFSLSGSEQANVEDGLFDVTIVEDATLLELAGGRLEERFFEQESENITRILASTLEINVAEGQTASFSLDGEVTEFESVTLETHSNALRMPVGEGYDPAPSLE